MARGDAAQRLGHVIGAEVEHSPTIRVFSTTSSKEPGIFSVVTHLPTFPAFRSWRGKTQLIQAALA